MTNAITGGSNMRVAVIGAGIIGAAIAYRLARRGCTFVHVFQNARRSSDALHSAPFSSDSAAAASDPRMLGIISHISSSCYILTTGRGAASLKSRSCAYRVRM